MSVPETFSFDKEGKPVRFPRIREHFHKIFLALVVILTGLLGFGLGRLSGGGERAPVKIEYDPNIMSAISNSGASSSPMAIQQGSAATTASGVYASSKGTKYYYPNCKSSVSDANKVTFASAAMAEAAGYTLASNCKAQ